MKVQEYAIIKDATSTAYVEENNTSIVDVQNDMQKLLQDAHKRFRVKAYVP